MPDDDSSPRVGSTRKLFSSLRDVLFENTAHTPVSVSAHVVLHQEPVETDVEAARQVLRSSVEAELGPGVREFTLQTQALLEVLPDPALRRRAALRVLSLKGTSQAQLSVELGHALATLVSQGEAFARKVAERRSALEVSQRSCIERHQLQSAEAERAMARLRAELEAQQVALGEALTQHGQALSESETALAELSLRERGFRRAFHDVESEYQNLKAELAKESA
jgi:hypothetical protein